MSKDKGNKNTKKIGTDNSIGKKKSLQLINLKVKVIMQALKLRIQNLN